MCPKPFRAGMHGSRGKDGRSCRTPVPPQGCRSILCRYRAPACTVLRRRWVSSARVSGVRGCLDGASVRACSSYPHGRCTTLWASHLLSEKFFLVLLPSWASFLDVGSNKKSCVLLRHRTESTAVPPDLTVNAYCLQSTHFMFRQTCSADNGRVPVGPFPARPHEVHSSCPSVPQFHRLRLSLPELKDRITIPRSSVYVE